MNRGRVGDVRLVFIVSKTLLEAFNQRLFTYVMWYDQYRIESISSSGPQRRKVCCELPIVFMNLPELAFMKTLFPSLHTFAIGVRFN